MNQITNKSGSGTLRIAKIVRRAVMRSARRIATVVWSRIGAKAKAIPESTITTM